MSLSLHPAARNRSSAAGTETPTGNCNRGDEGLKRAGATAGKRSSSRIPSPSAPLAAALITRTRTAAERRRRSSRAARARIPSPKGGRPSSPTAARGGRGKGEGAPSRVVDAAADRGGWGHLTRPPRQRPRSCQSLYTPEGGSSANWLRREAGRFACGFPSSPHGWMWGRPGTATEDRTIRPPSREKGF